MCVCVRTCACVRKAVLVHPLLKVNTLYLRGIVCSTTATIRQQYFVYGRKKIAHVHTTRNLVRTSNLLVVERVIRAYTYLRSHWHRPQSAQNICWKPIFLDGLRTLKTSNIFHCSAVEYSFQIRPKIIFLSLAATLQRVRTYSYVVAWTLFSPAFLILPLPCFAYQRNEII